MKEQEWVWLSSGHGNAGRAGAEQKRVLETERRDPPAVREWLADNLAPRAVRESDELRPMYDRAGAVKMMIDRRGLMGMGTGSEVTHLLEREGRASERSNPIFGVGLKFAKRKNDVQVIQVVPFGPASRSRQILSGDIVLSIDGIRATDLPISELERICSGAQGASCTIRLARKAGWDAVGKLCGVEFDVVVRRGPQAYSVPESHTTLQHLGSEANICGGIHRFSNLEQGRVAGTKARTVAPQGTRKQGSSTRHW